jgi:nucleoside-diphosphate-sugar epimerase
VRVLVAGATGALGTPLVHRLVARGHQVLGLTRGGADNVGKLAGLGATAVLADALDRDALLRAVEPLRADAVIHEMTALTKAPLRRSGMAMTNRLRTDGTRNLLEAAQVLGAARFVTQSIVLGYGYRDHGEHWLTEDDPFGVPDGGPCDEHVAAMLANERQTFTAPEGIALRYGMLYGGDIATVQPMLMKRRLPVFAGGPLAWVHHDDAAAATVAALERGVPGAAYNIVDDQPAGWTQLYTALAAALGAPTPIRLPKWLFRLAAPYPATFALDATFRVSNDRARRELQWKPRYATFSEGVATAKDQG